MGNMIIKDGQMVIDDWHFLGADEPLPDSTRCEGQSSLNEQPSLVFPFTRWINDREQCLAHPGLRGVSLANTDCITQLLPDLDKLQLICIDFPSAVDGRGYSQARLLRNRYGFKKELRAVGEVLVDQLFLLRRTGFNAFALQPDQVLCQFQLQKYLTPFSITYQ